MGSPLLYALDCPAMESPHLNELDVIFIFIATTIVI
jgi:hypothetical protein